MRQAFVRFALLMAGVGGWLLPWSAGQAPQQASGLRVVNEQGQATSLTDKDLAKLPRTKVQARDHAGNLAMYEGVSVAEVLKAGKATLGKELRGKLLANHLLVEAADGYRVAFSLPELDPFMTDNVTLLADRKDGKALDAKEGPYRLVVPHDKTHARWVRQVTVLRVQAGADVKAGARDGKVQPPPR